MKTLLRLQDLDLKIEARKARELEIPKQKRKFDVQRQRLKHELAACEKSVTNLQLEQRECEGDIEQRQKQIDKYQVQLNTVKKNEEYQALLHEIEGLKKQIAQREERIITILLELDEAKERLIEDKKRIEAELKDIDAQCAAIDAQLAEAVRERQELEALRGPLREEADQNLLMRYERIRKSKAGAAIVPLEREICGGCRLAVPPQIANEVLAGRLHACNHCGRLLYHAENVEAKV